jgi:hypothetical protein
MRFIVDVWLQNELAGAGIVGSDAALDLHVDKKTQQLPTRYFFSYIHIKQYNIYLYIYI